MKRIHLLILTCILLLITSCKAQNNGSSTPKTKHSENQQIITVEEVSQIINTLASDKFKGRDTATPEFDQAADYVISLFQKYGFSPLLDEQFKDQYTFKSSTAYNLVASVKPYDASKQSILIGAHLDHLKPDQTNTVDSIFNGANDNASGCTAALLTANYLSKQNIDQNVIIALFSGEEHGLLGSEHLAIRLKQQNIPLDYMINYEMVGTVLSSGANQVYVTGYELTNLAAEMNKALNFDFVQFLPQAKELSLFRRSDNYAFYTESEIPAQTFSTFDFNNFNYYHKVDDEIDQLNLENMTNVIQLAAEGIHKLLANHVVIEFNE